MIWPESKDIAAVQLGAYLYLNAFFVIIIMLLVSVRGLRYTRLLGLILVMIYLIATVSTFVAGFLVDRIE